MSKEEEEADAPVGMLASLLSKLGIRSQEEKQEIPGEFQAVLETQQEEQEEEEEEALSLESIGRGLREGRFKRVVILAGAGMSVAAGMPDFRTPGTGLYSNLSKYNLPHPEAIFTLDFFRGNPEPFYLLAEELLPGKYAPTDTHYFVRLLHEKQLLLRHFTQNIDMLERVAGVPDEALVEAHGNFARAHCIDCSTEHSFAFVKEAMREGVPRCQTCNGYVKPDITFFGESLPRRFFERSVPDMRDADLVIVIGTSLTVFPFASLVENCRDEVPRVLFNRERVGPFADESSERDVCVLADCDDAMWRLVQIAGWEEELRELIKRGKSTFGDYSGK